MSMELLCITLVYLLVGFAAGIASGLIGFGGGFIVVPVLYWGLHLVGVSGDITMHIAVGTSLFVMLAAGLNGTYKHHQRGSVCWSLATRFIPAIALGTATAACVSTHLSTRFLHYLFLFYILAALLHGLTKKEFSHSQDLEPRVPGRLQSAVIGFFMSLVSSTVGVGGSVISIPYLRHQHFPMKQAVGTSLSFILPVSIVGTIGYMIAGQGVASLPAYTLGFVYVPAAVGLILGNLFGVPVGVRWAHSWADRSIARAYLLVVALLLVVTALEH